MLNITDAQRGIRRTLALATTAMAVGVATLAVTGCGIGKEEINAETSCSDYLNTPADVRHDAAIRISADVSTSSPGNPMWALTADASCGANPQMTVGRAVGGPG